MKRIKYPLPHRIIQFTVRKYSVHTAFSEIKEEILFNYVNNGFK